MRPASSSSVATRADPRRRRRRRRFVRWAVAVLALAWAALAGWSLLSARAALNDARDLAEALRDSSSEVASFDELRGELEVVADAADRADERLGAPWLRPLTIVPVLGRQIRSATALSDSASDALATVVDVVDAADRSRNRTGDRAARPVILRDLAADAEQAATALAAADLGPSEGLIGSLHDARADLGEELDDARQTMSDLAAVASGIADLIGPPGRYLVLAGNNSQMQNGNGMFLTAGEMVTGNGDVNLAEMEPTAGLPPVPTAVPLEPALAERWGFLDPNNDFRHLGVSPRFPVTAETARSIWTAMGRAEVDGVIAVDVVALEALLEIVGPVSLPDGEVAADNVRQLLLHDQYLVFDDAVDQRTQEARRERQSEIAVAAFNRLSEVLDDVDLDGIRTLLDAVRGRHLIIWSHDDEQQARWEELEAAGALTDRSLLLSLVNRSGVKLDWFVRMEAEMEVAGSGPTREVTVRVDVTNGAPASGQPSYIIGPYPGSGLAAGTYLGVLALTLPADAAGGAVDGETALPVVGSEGPTNRVVGARIEVPAGTTVSRTFRFTVGAGEVVVEASGRAEPTSWRFGSTVLDDSERRVIVL